MTRQKTDTPRQKIDRLAESIADAAVRDGIGLEERVEALKALTAYLGVVQKGRGGRGDDPSDGVDFDAFRLAATEENEDGSAERGPQARAHTGRRQRVRDIRAGVTEPN